MINKIEVLCHSSIRICKNNMIIYIDPFKVEKEYNDADIVMITHSHYDHFSENDLKRVIKENTVILTVGETYERTVKLGVKKENIIIVKQNGIYNVNNLEIETVPAYNLKKLFHKKSSQWVGYIINFENERDYIMGDTDFVEELKQIKCDVLFIPIGGIYTMNVKEAAECVKTLKPKKVIPVHYGEIVGKYKDAEKFKELIKDVTEVDILIKEK